jgi:zinc transport system substrate-binding protein
MHLIVRTLTVILIIAQTLVSASDVKTKNTRTILTSFYPMYIITLNIADNVPGVKVINMTKPQTGCLHDYQLTPQDMKTLGSASVFIANGGGMESFIEKVLKEHPSLPVIDASNGIELITEEHDHDADHQQGHDHGEVNPHVWVSVSGAIDQVKNIAGQLSTIDSSNAEAYKKNADAYIAKLETLKKEMHDGLGSIKSRNIITFHEAFPYFAKEFNLEIVAVIEREPGSEPSAGELAETVAIVKKHDVKALFAEPQYPAKAAETIAHETGAKLYSLDPAVTGQMTKNAYIDIMKSNLLVLVKALQ